MRIIHTTEIPGQFPVILAQHESKGPLTFRVKYGAEVRTDLDYEQACSAYGQCIMHALSCNGALYEDGQ